MRHADDGLLHAWLDGALVGEEADALRQHLDLCANCRARLEEAERLRDEADAILAGATPLELPRPPFAEVVAQAQALAAEAHLPPPRLRLLQGKRIAWRNLGWAASILLAVGAGWWGRGLLHQPQRIAVSEEGLPVQGKARDDRSLLLRLEQPAPGAPAPAAASAPAPAATGAGQAFQTLATPTVVPPDVPPPAPKGFATQEAGFSGEGAEDNRPLSPGRVTRVTAENVEAQPTFTPYTVAPELKNRTEVQRALERAYPPARRDAGIGGTAVVWVLIDERGAVLKSQVKASSGFADMDRAALRVTRMMRFSPGMNRDAAVKVWVQLPIVFRPDADAPFRPPMSRPLADAAQDRPTSPPAIALSERADRGAAGKAQIHVAAPQGAAQVLDTTRHAALNAIVAVGYGKPESRELEESRQELAGRTRAALTGLAPADVASAAVVVGLPVVRSLPRTSPNEISRVLQRLPSGDTIEVVALTAAREPSPAAAPSAALADAWSRPGTLTVSTTDARGTVAIRGAISADSLEALLRHVLFPPRTGAGH